MSNTNLPALKLLLVAAIAIFSGCASVQAPSGYLPGASETQWDVYGGWITVAYSDSGTINTADGEFIGFQDSVVYVLTKSEPVSIRCEDVRSASFDIYSKKTWLFAGWTLLGSVSVLSHGYYAVLSLPLWLLTGIPSTISESLDGRYAENTPTIYWWQSISKFSRFPQGIPKQVDLRELKLKRFSL